MPEKCWADGKMLGGAGFLEWALAACLRSRGDSQCAKLWASFAKMAEQPPGKAAGRNAALRKCRASVPDGLPFPMFGRRKALREMVRG